MMSCVVSAPLSRLNLLHPIFKGRSFFPLPSFFYLTRGRGKVSFEPGFQFELYSGEKTWTVLCNVQTKVNSSIEKLPHPSKLYRPFCPQLLYSTFPKLDLLRLQSTVSPLTKLWMFSLTRPNFSQPSSRIALVYQSFCSRMIADRLLYDWITEKKLVEKKGNTSKAKSRFGFGFENF